MNSYNYKFVNGWCVANEMAYVSLPPPTLSPRNYVTRQPGEVASLRRSLGRWTKTGHDQDKFHYHWHQIFSRQTALVWPQVQV